MVSNPEFVREGAGVFHADRVVVGVETPRALEQMREIYKPVLVLCNRSSFTKSLHLAEDRICRRGPNKRLRVAIVVL